MTSSLTLQLDKVAEIRALLGTDDPELLHDAVEGETDLFELVDWLIGKLADQEEFETAVAARIDALKARGQSCKAKQQRIRDAIHACLDASGQSSLRRPEATLTLTHRKPAMASVDESLLPDRFFRIKREVDKAAIKAEIEHGVDVPGVLMGNGGVTLTVRRK